MLSEAGGRGSRQPSETNTLCYIGLERLCREGFAADETSRLGIEGAAARRKKGGGKIGRRTRWQTQARLRWKNMTSSGKEWRGTRRDGKREVEKRGQQKSGEIRGGQTHSSIVDKTSRRGPRGRDDVWGIEERRKLWQKFTSWTKKREEQGKWRERRLRSTCSW